MVLAIIQEKIQKLYGIDPLPNIVNFLISKKELQALNLLERPQVVLRQEKGQVRMGVYVGKVPPNLSLEDPKGIHTYSCLVEEVSHFIYLFWNMTHDQAFSLLDVEVQGEIDKFLLMADQFGFSEELVQKIFGRFLLRKNLPLAEIDRYKKAHQLGKKFIHNIIKSGQSRSQMISFLRSFYRKGSVERIYQLHKMKGYRG